MDKNHDSSILNDYAYDETFYRYLQQGATRSAKVVVPLVIDRLKISSVLDVGCGAGAWLAAYQAHGLRTYVGVDGDYVKPSSLLRPASAFLPRNIAKPFDLGRRFDLVQCLEVGEHVEPQASRTLVANLVRHGDFVLFSAAIPGQGGENHVNEQSYEFWRALFAEHEYFPYDFLRPLLHGAAPVEIWYRHNTILYVANRSRLLLNPTVLETQVPSDRPIPDVSSVPYKLRTRILANLSVESLSRLAVLKHRWLLAVRYVTGRRSK